MKHHGKVGLGDSAERNSQRFGTLIGNGYIVFPRRWSGIVAFSPLKWEVIIFEKRCMVERDTGTPRISTAALQVGGDRDGAPPRISATKERMFS